MTEADGVRVVGLESCDFIQKVPGTTGYKFWNDTILRATTTQLRQYPSSGQVPHPHLQYSMMLGSSFLEDLPRQTKALGPYVQSLLLQ